MFPIDLIDHFIDQVGFVVDHDRIGLLAELYIRRILHSPDPFQQPCRVSTLPPNEEGVIILFEKALFVCRVLVRCRDHLLEFFLKRRGILAHVPCTQLVQVAGVLAQDSARRGHIGQPLDGFAVIFAQTHVQISQLKIFDRLYADVADEGEKNNHRRHCAHKITCFCFLKHRGEMQSCHFPPSCFQSILRSSDWQNLCFEMDYSGMVTVTPDSWSSTTTWFRASQAC